MNNHLQPEELSVYLDGEISEEERKRVEEHLLVCSTCSATLRSYQEVSEAVRGLPRRVFRGELAYRGPRKSFYPLLAPATITFLFLIGLSYYAGYYSGVSRLFSMAKEPKGAYQMKQAPSEEPLPSPARPLAEETPPAQPAPVTPGQAISDRAEGASPPSAPPSPPAETFLPGFLPPQESVELCVSAPLEQPVVLEFETPEEKEAVEEKGLEPSAPSPQASSVDDSQKRAMKAQKAKVESPQRVVMKLSPDSLKSLKSLLSRYFTVEAVQQGDQTILKLKIREAGSQGKSEVSTSKEKYPEVKSDEKK